MKAINYECKLVVFLTVMCSPAPAAGNLSDNDRGTKEKELYTVADVFISEKTVCRLSM